MKNAEFIMPNGINKDVYLALAEVFFTLGNMEAWREEIREKKTYKKEMKEALNLKCFLIISKVAEIEMGIEPDYFGIMPIIIERLFKKAGLFNVSPKNKEQLQQEFKDYENACLGYVRNKIMACTSNEFMTFLEDTATKDEVTIDLYNAAKTVATCIEVAQIDECDLWVPSLKKRRSEKVEQVNIEMNSFYIQFPFLLDIMNRTGKYRLVREHLEEMSELRNVRRWQKYTSPRDCTILQHDFESSAFAWVYVMETSQNKALATILWQRLLVHDDTEKYLTDIPGPLKNDIFNGEEKLRAAVERAERDTFYQDIAVKFPPEMSEWFAKLLDEEEEVIIEGKTFSMHPMVKIADYFDADCEAFMCLWAGSLCADFRDGVLKRSLGEVRSPGMDAATRHWYDKTLPMVLLE